MTNVCEYRLKAVRVFTTDFGRAVEFYTNERQAWGGVMTDFYDPDKNLLTLVQ